ncbi:protein Iojap, chloroplastic-like [Silene latifolia]|uniref:protein Iojap, chloroplastic-like n=1 Tax=Silene latifolia TaxID=37657 RepID=UPI003D77F8DC
MALNFVSISTINPRFVAAIHMRYDFRQLGFRRFPYSKTSQELKLPLSPSTDHSSMFCSTALGSDVSEDTDDMFDDMFEKYGKVVFTRTDQKSTTSEVDDDAESLSFAVAMAKVANDVKAEDIKVLFVKPLVYWTRFFIIATAFSRPQLDAIRTKMADLAEEKFGKVPNGNSKPNSWTLLDFGDVVIHLFLPPQRAFYNLEEFYGNATLIDLPFEDEKPFRR